MSRIERGPAIVEGCGDHAVPIVNRIRELRAEQRLTQADLAARVGCSAVSINRIELHCYHPSAEMMLRIAAALGRSTDDVFKRASNATREARRRSIRS